MQTSSRSTVGGPSRPIARSRIASSTDTNKHLRRCAQSSRYSSAVKYHFGIAPDRDNSAGCLHRRSAPVKIGRRASNRGAKVFASAETGAGSEAGQVRKVAVVGGTHGNEFTGVWVAKRLARYPEELLAGLGSLEVQTVIGNPAAVAANRRFLDDDLNRQFTAEKLTEELREDGPREAARARELNALLGPTPGTEADPGDEPVDLVVDLHTSTGNMGTTIILHDDSALCLAAAAYAFKVLGGEEEGVRILLEDPMPPGPCQYLSSTGRYGMEIEVGPTPQGVLRMDCVKRTEDCLRAVLEYMHLRNTRGLPEDAPKAGDAVEAYVTTGAKIPWPRDPEDGFPDAVVHSHIQDNDWVPVHRGDPLFQRLDGSEIAYDGFLGESFIPIFVNEGGYYYGASGLGVCVAKQTTVAIPSDYQ